jgi:acyl carrier protein
MVEKDVTSLVISSLYEVFSEIYEKEQAEMPYLDKSTYLIGRDSVLDSLGLVTLIVNIEQKLADRYGFSLTIADERALSQQKSPFRTVKSLSEYIFSLIPEKVQLV